MSRAPGTRSDKFLLAGTEMSYPAIGPMMILQTRYALFVKTYTYLDSSI